MWVEDCIQEIAVAVWRESNGKPLKWVAWDAAKVFMHSRLRPAGLLRHREHKGGTTEVVQPVSLDWLRDDGFDAGQQSFESAAVERLQLQLALGGVDRRALAALWLCGLGYSCGETCRLLGIGPTSVVAALRRGRAVMREVLTERA